MVEKRTQWDDKKLLFVEPEYSVDQLDLMWKTIQRFDFYINSTNTKASAIIAFNTFVLSGIVLKASEILPSKEISPCMYLISGIALMISAMASLVSLIATFFVISPFLKSFGGNGPNSRKRYSSTIFFSHVAQLDSAHQLLEQVKSSSDEMIYQDLSIQTYSLAKGLNGKYKRIKIIFYWILLAQLPSFGIVTFIKLHTLIFL